MTFKSALWVVNFKHFSTHVCGVSGDVRIMYELGFVILMCRVLLTQRWYFITNCVGTPFTPTGPSLLNSPAPAIDGAITLF